MPRNARNTRPPAKAQPRRPEPRLRSEDSAEDFDFTGIVNSSEDNADEPTQRRIRSRASVEPTARSTNPTGVPPSALAPTAGSTNPTRVPSPAPAPTASSSTSRNTAADIIYFFDRAPKASGEKTICKICKEKASTTPGIRFEFSAATSNTSLRNHLEKEHEEEYARLSKQGKWKNQLPHSRVQSEAGSTLNTTGAFRTQFTPKAFLQHLISFIVADDQSLNVVECPEFRSLLLLLRQDLQDKDIPRRTKVRESIVKAWEEYFKILKQELANIPGKVSFTADIWSNSSRYPYLAITGHWIARTQTGSLQLNSALLAFHRIRGSHNGQRLARIVLHLLDRVDVTVKVGHWTLDNASVNTTFLQALEEHLKTRDIPFDYEDNHILCFPHIINICVTHVSESFTNMALANDDAEFVASLPPRDPDRQTFEEARMRDPVALCRGSVCAIRASGKRRDLFNEVIQDGNAKGWFKQGDKAILVQRLQLLRDVRTRWDSLYQMIRRFREMRPAVDYFLSAPLNRELSKFRMTDQEWQVLQDFEMILNIPHRVQQSMSSEKTPILSNTVPAFEMFMMAWEKLGEKYPHLEPYTTVGLEWAVKYYKKMDKTRAYLVAMILNPTIRMSWIRKHWDEEYISRAIESIKELVPFFPQNLMNSDYSHLDSQMVEYRAWNKPDLDIRVDCAARDQPFALDDLAGQYGLEDFMDFVDHTVQHEQSIDDEFNAYMTAPLAPKGTDILKFWELNERRHPTLFAIALDYLPIQASAVPCERVFSSSAQTDTTSRNRIHEVLMEALQMLKYAQKKNRLHFTEGLITPESDMLVPADDDVDLLAQVVLEWDRGIDAIIAALGDDEEGFI